ncbi:MAG: TetR/AcrR family transcriptional regulator [Ilumatobacteraceae bacterium]|nr:TetR/AcrR family transcriptional regulator [Acidimicrobiales bacterium]MCB9394596.1 TetR/AcrR family transcriptional regulator [Acidimicrobiaceae bacterium]
MATPERPYHHGNLARALLDAAAEVIGEMGPAQMSLREVARRSGVSNAAPVHHFGDKAGLFTALAAEGFERLADTLSAATDGSADGQVDPAEVFLEIGVAYVRFAVANRAHFEVMFRPELYHRESSDVLAAASRAAQHLYGPAADVIGDGITDDRDAGTIAWSLVHGFATLVLNGNLDTEASADPEGTVRRLGRLAFSPKGGAAVP